MNTFNTNNVPFPHRVLPPTRQVPEIMAQKMGTYNGIYGYVKRYKFPPRSTLSFLAGRCLLLLSLQLSQLQRLCVYVTELGTDSVPAPMTASGGLVISPRFTPGPYGPFRT